MPDAPIPETRLARAMTLKKALRMNLDETLLALRTSFADLPEEAFRRFVLPGRMNIVTLTMHCLQQIDSYNRELQLRRKAAAGDKSECYPFRRPEVRYDLYDRPPDELPKPGDPFPTVTEALAYHELLTAHLFPNIDALPDEAFLQPVQPHWPHLADLFFRASYHINAHIRQIWHLRGLMQITTGYPTQTHA